MKWELPRKVFEYIDICAPFLDLVVVVTYVFLGVCFLFNCGGFSLLSISVVPVDYLFAFENLLICKHLLLLKMKIKYRLELLLENTSNLWLIATSFLISWVNDPNSFLFSKIHFLDWNDIFKWFESPSIWLVGSLWPLVFVAIPH